MKVFVTGGTGLVGSNVIKVAREKYDADVVASMYKRVPAAPAHYQIEHLDITDAAAVRSALKKYSPDFTRTIIKPESTASRSASTTGFTARTVCWAA